MADATIKDIADRTGVSYATVSRTLNNRSGVNPHTRDKILTAARELGYQPNLHARSLKTNQTFTLALIVPDISNPFFSDIALAVNDYAYKRGYTTILCSTNWDSQIEQAQLHQLREQRVDGIIYKPAGQILDTFTDLQIPTIIISCLSNDHCSFIEVDNHKGGYMAALHLIECGYKRIAFIGGKRESSSNLSRLTGLVDGLTQNGSAADDDLIKFGPFTIESGYQLTQQVMEQPNPPDGIFCGNDLIALGAFQYLGEHSIRVPQDVGLIGFDDVYLASLPQIQMTTIAQPRHQMGSLAAELLLKHIENPQNPDISRILLEPQLIIRKSTRK